MTRIASLASLLHAALQDLHAGYRDQAERLPAAAARDEALRTLLDAERARSGQRAQRLVAIGLDPSGPANLWMAGVLDDAERDAASTEAGRLLDIALAGAIRKGKVAEAAACDTALALAGDDRAISDVANALRGEALAAGDALLAVIRRLA